MNKQILIIGPSWVGDMVMAQALFKLIKQQEPSTHIDVIAPAWSIDILQRMPEVRNRICIPVAHGEFGLIKRIKLAYRLSKVRYDQAIVLTNTWKSALIPWLADIPVRTGWFGEMRWFLLNDRRHLNKERFPKMVQRYAALIYPKSKHPPENIPAPHLTTDPAAVAAVVQKFALNLNQPVLALCPGAAYGPAKRWPEAYFAHIAKEKIAAGWQVWLFGSQQDEPVIEKIRADINAPTTSFAGKINLLETVDLLSLATSVVTNDSGLLHIAASLDKPLVAIYGSTSPVFTPPLGDKSHVLSENLACSPCFKRVCPLKHFNCMHQIKPEKVLAALDNLENK